MSTDNIEALLKLAEKPTETKQLDFSKNPVRLTPKYLRDLIQELNIQNGIIQGSTKVHPVFLFDYLITWGYDNNLIKKYQKIKYNKYTNLWMMHELTKVYNINYKLADNYGYFLLDISNFKNYDITEYNVDSFLMMRKYKLKYDKQKQKKENLKDRVFKEENKEKEKTLKAFEELLRSKKCT